MAQSKFKKRCSPPNIIDYFYLYKKIFYAKALGVKR